MNIQIVLDESKFGCTGDTTMPLFAFYKVHKDGKHEFITARNCDGTTLIAVTKEQYKQWKSCNIISEMVK